LQGGESCADRSFHLKVDVASIHSNRELDNANGRV
jgi:hypothetical protein